MTNEWKTGDRIGNLRVERELGRGGFATVYLAHDTRLGRPVALKALHHAGSDAPADLDRFLAEARLIAELESPHIVTLYQLHDAPDGALLLEMQYVDGGSLETLLRAGGLTLEGAESILRGILRGLAAAHDKGVLHRDIKPGNILLADGRTPKLTDFGLARRIDDELELEELGLGTPVYMAPELLIGDRATVQSDLWSVGVVAYELLAGRRPFPAVDAPSFFGAVHNEEPEPLPPIVPAPLRDLVARCLRKNPQERPVDCRDALALLDAAAGKARTPETLPAAALVGRESESARLDAVLGHGKGHTVLLTGTPGIGKTALCTDAERRARARGFAWIQAKLSTIEGPLVALIEAAREASRGRDDPATQGFGPEGARVKKLLTGDAYPVLEDPEQALWTLRHFLSGVAAARPLVLCIDDAQHASEEDAELIEGLARRLAERPFTLVVATRPAAPVTARFPDAERIELGGLGRDTLYTLLESRTHASLPAEVVARVHERTDGHPLHALELVRHLEETGALRRRDDRLELHRRLDLDSIPARHRDVVHARLAALEDEDRALLELAAVDGQTFDGRALAAVQGIPLLATLRRLQRLCRRGQMIAAAPDGYRFADRPTYEVLYEDMAPELRTELHRALAEHLETRDDEIDAARLARHWERCGERRRAAPYLLDVAARARARQENRRFVDLARRAGVLEEPPLVDVRAHIDLLLDLGHALIGFGEMEDADSIYAALEALAGDDADGLFRERIRTRRNFAYVLAARPVEGDVESWRATATRLGETRDGAVAWMVGGDVARRDSDLENARALYEEARARFQTLDLDWGRERIESRLGSVDLRSSRFARAQLHFAESARLADRMGLSVTAARSRLNAALGGMLGGQFEGVDALLERAIRTLDLAGNVGSVAHARLYQAEAAYAVGDARGALRLAEAAIPTLERVGRHLSLINFHRLRAELLTVADRLDEAQEAIDAALDYAVRGHEFNQRLIVHGVAALIATADGRDEDAQRQIAALRELDPERRATSNGIVLALCEAVLVGLPLESLDSLSYLAQLPQERLLLDLTRRWATEQPPGDALAELVGMNVGLRGATYELLVNWLAADFAERAGDPLAERTARAKALAAAARLGHARASEVLRY